DVDWRQVLECAGRAQRRRRFGFPARGGVNAGFRCGACAESKAAWRFASRRTPKNVRGPLQELEQFLVWLAGCPKRTWVQSPKITSPKGAVQSIDPDRRPFRAWEFVGPVDPGRCATAIELGHGRDDSPCPFPPI